MKNSPELTLIGPPPQPDPLAPPTDLGAAGTKLWNDLHRDFEIVDASGLAQLHQICGAADKVAEYSAIIERDGAVQRSKAGIEVHPSLIRDVLAGQFRRSSFAQTRFGHHRAEVRTRPPERRLPMNTIVRRARDGQASSTLGNATGVDRRNPAGAELCRLRPSGAANFVGPEMRRDWANNRDELIEFLAKQPVHHARRFPEQLGPGCSRAATTSQQAALGGGASRPMTSDTDAPEMSSRCLDLDQGIATSPALYRGQTNTPD